MALGRWGRTDRNAARWALEYEGIYIFICKKKNWNQVKFDPPHWNQVNLYHTQNPSQFSCSSQKQVIFGRHTSIKSIPPLTQQSNQLHLYTEINSSSIPHTGIKSVSTTISKIKSISMLTLKTSNGTQKQSQLWLPHKKQVNFGPHTKFKSISIPHTKPS